MTWVEFRSRTTAPGPFGDSEPPFEGTLGDVLARGHTDRDTGMAPVIERRVHGAGWLPYRHQVKLTDLRDLALARECDVGSLHPATGKRVISKGWWISEAGHRIIGVAATADPLDFDLEAYRPQAAKS